jgi:hypothetical protein
MMHLFSFVGLLHHADLRLISTIHGFKLNFSETPVTASCNTLNTCFGNSVV